MYVKLLVSIIQDSKFAVVPLQYHVGPATPQTSAPSVSSIGLDAANDTLENSLLNAEIGHLPRCA